MTLVTPVSQQPQNDAKCPQEPMPTITPCSQPACSGCIKLHAEIKQDVKIMMERFEMICNRLDLITEEKERERRSVKDELEMSDSGSEEKDIPSPTDSRESPTLIQGSRKRKPMKDTVHRAIDCDMEPDDTASLNADGGAQTPPTTTSRETPTGTPLSQQNMMDAMNFMTPNGFPGLDPIAHQQQLLQFIVSQTMSAPPASSQTPTSTASVKQEQIDAHALFDHLQNQFKEVSGLVREDREDEDQNASVSRCSNCMTTKTTAWRRDLNGKLVCNACGLYFRLHRTHRPVHMRKDFIQQRFRRKTKEEEMQVSSPSAMFNSLFGMQQLAGGTATSPFNFLEQFNQMNSVQEQLNSMTPAV